MGTHASSAVVHTANQLIPWCAFEKGEQPAAHDLVVVDDQEPAARRPFGTVATSPRRWRIAPGGTPPGTPDGTRASRARRTTRPSGCLGRSTKDCVRNGRCCCAAERRRADRSTAVSLTDPHAAADGPGERRSLLDPRCAADLVAVKGWLGATVRNDADHTRSPAAGGEPALDCVLAPARHRRPRALRAGTAVSRAGFDGGCDPRILSLGKEDAPSSSPLARKYRPEVLERGAGLVFGRSPDRARR